MTWVDAFKADLLTLMKKRGADVVEVLGWEEKTEYSGYCETCYNEDIVVEITYITSKGVTGVYTHYNTFGGLMRELADDEL